MITSQLEKQPTLDRILVQSQVEELRKTVEDVRGTLAELKGQVAQQMDLSARIDELAERILKVESDLSVLGTGSDMIYRALEIAGIMKNGEAVQPGQSESKEPVAAVSEENFKILKFESQEGAKLGQYAVAYKQSNFVDKWTSAFNILRQGNATIKDRYLGPGYEFSYWLYGEGKIYRQKLKHKNEAKP